MFRKAILLFLFIFSAFNLPAEECQREIVYTRALCCEPALVPLLKKIEQVPEAKQVIAKVLETGPLSIKMNDRFPEKFEGYWDQQSRTIYITKQPDSTEGSMITSILFEHHNALRNDDLDQLDLLAVEGVLDKEGYTRAFEQIEYENAKATAKLLDLGRERGIFPSDCSWKLPNHFEEHYRYQRKAGHSAWIDEIYDQVMTYYQK